MRGRQSLFVSALNALIDNGLDLSYDSIEEAERRPSMNHAPQRITCQFSIQGIPCITTCRPDGYGEERVAVIYNSNDAPLVEHICQVGNAIQLLRPGITAGLFYVERESGPYIMSTRTSINNFRYTRPDLQRLVTVVVEPNGFAV